MINESKAMDKIDAATKTNIEFDSAGIPFSLANQEELAVCLATSCNYGLPDLTPGSRTSFLLSEPLPADFLKAKGLSKAERRFMAWFQEHFQTDFGFRDDRTYFVRSTTKIVEESGLSRRTVERVLGHGNHDTLGILIERQVRGWGGLNHHWFRPTEEFLGFFGLSLEDYDSVGRVSAQRRRAIVTGTDLAPVPEADALRRQRWTQRGGQDESDTATLLTKAALVAELKAIPFPVKK